MGQIDQHVLKNKAVHKVDYQHRIYSKLHTRIKYWFRAEYLSLNFQSIYILRYCGIMFMAFESFYSKYLMKSLNVIYDKKRHVAICSFKNQLKVELIVEWIRSFLSGKANEGSFISNHPSSGNTLLEIEICQMPRKLLKRHNVSSGVNLSLN